MAINYGYDDALKAIAQSDGTFTVEQLRKDGPGYLYALSHPSFVGVVKIGCTAEPQARLRSINGGVPIPYEMVVVTPVRARYLAERFVHWRLRGCRIKGGEFFRLSVDNAARVLATADERCHLPLKKTVTLQQIGRAMRSGFAP